MALVMFGDFSAVTDENLIWRFYRSPGFTDELSKFQISSVSLPTIKSLKSKLAPLIKRPEAWLRGCEEFIAFLTNVSEYIPPVKLSESKKSSLDLTVVDPANGWPSWGSWFSDYNPMSMVDEGLVSGCHSVASNKSKKKAIKVEDTKEY